MLIDGVNVPTKAVALIKRRRLQLLIHSCIYYRLGTNIITDSTYDSWGKELVELQRKYGVIKIGCYDSEFEKWQPKEGNSFSGFQLPIGNEEIIAKAERLVNYINNH